jgi:hypothetical protein
VLVAGDLMVDEPVEQVMGEVDDALKIVTSRSQRAAV